MKFLSKLYAIVEVGLAIAAVAMCVFMFFKHILAPLAPIITIGLVLFGLLFSLEKRITAILTIGGLILYGASWPAVATWGTWPGLAVWTLGMLMYLSGVFRPFPCLQTRAT
ncbi:MAG: hypothetical protein AAB667_01720 [Patescibacteria group bacterium]